MFSAQKLDAMQFNPPCGWTIIFGLFYPMTKAPPNSNGIFLGKLIVTNPPCWWLGEFFRKCPKHSSVGLIVNCTVQGSILRLLSPFFRGVLRCSYLFGDDDEEEEEEDDDEQHDDAEEEEEEEE